MKAILLAGGMGTRLRPLTAHTPKPIVPIFNRPFLHYQIDLLKQVPEIDEAILSLNYQPNRIAEVLGDGSANGLALRYVVEPEPLGTGGAIKFASTGVRDTVVVFNGDVLTQIDLASVIRLHRDRRARATIVLTPVENPVAYGLVETERDGSVKRFIEKPSADDITTNNINAGVYVLEPETFDRIPDGVPWSIERAYFPSLVERKETFVAYLYDGYWIDIGAPDKYTQVHRDIMDGTFRAAPFAGAPARHAFVSPTARIADGATIEGPCFIDDDVTVEKGARVGAYSALGHHSTVEEGASVEGSILWPRCLVHREASVIGAILGRECRVGPGARVTGGTVLGDHSTLSDYTRNLTMQINPDVFKAYDVRGLYPGEINEDVARFIGQGLAAYLRVPCIGISRDMRVSSPTIAAALIEGIRAQGTDVIDYGMMGTDMLYFAVVRDGLGGGAQVTASHNPKQYNGIKMVRAEALPLSGDAGIGDIRDMIATGGLPAPAPTPGTLTSRSVVSDYIEKVMSFVDVAAIKPFSVVLDAGSGMAGLVAPAMFDRLPCTTVKLCFTIDGTFPNHEANPLIEENRRDITAEVIARKADIGIAWDGDADRCFFIDGSGEFISGDFVTALLAEAFLLKYPGSTIVYDLRASHAVKDIAAKYGGRALMNRVGHAFIKQRMRDEDAVFGGEVTGHYYFRDFYYADNGLIPALLMLELMSKKGKSLRDLLQPFRERYFISGEINTKLASMQDVPRKLAAIEARYADATIARMDGISVDHADWHFNVRPSNTEPLLRLNLEAASPAMMERKRDEVLEMIRG